MLKPETISILEIVKLNANNASEGWSNSSSRKRVLGQTSREEIDVMYISVSGKEIIWDATWLEKRKSALTCISLEIAFAAKGACTGQAGATRKFSRQSKI